MVFVGNFGALILQSFNPISEPFDDWSNEFDINLKHKKMDFNDLSESFINVSCTRKGEKDFTFPCKLVPEDDDEVTESKIRAFLDEKVDT